MLVWPLYNFNFLCALSFERIISEAMPRVEICAVARFKKMSSTFFVCRHGANRKRYDTDPLN